MQMGPQLAAAASLPADISEESGRHGGLRSWTPEEALAEGVPPNHVPRSVRPPPLGTPLLMSDFCWLHGAIESSAYQLVHAGAVHFMSC